MVPSVNALYRGGGKGSKGGVYLTDVAKQYANNVKDRVAQHLGVLQSDFSSLETAYSIDVTAYFPELENAGWFQKVTRGKNAGERKAKARYKVIDVDNRVKFVQDCVCKALGMPNDSQVFEEAARKKKGDEKMVVVIRAIDPTEHLEGP
jgi:Holliday junction resolvase RusA-like endonuclease